MRSFTPVMSEAKFTIPEGAKIYTIGSCFARNIEVALQFAGFEVPTRMLDIDHDVYVSKPHYPNTVLNKYSPQSMAIEIQRGLGKLSYVDHGLIQVKPGQWYDPQTSHTGAMSREAALDLRGKLDNLSREIRSADVVVLALGLTETWRDKETGLIFNQLNPGVLASVRDRIEFFNAGYTDIRDRLDEALRQLREEIKDVKVIITVSPVPMVQTFTPMDVISANSYSKATLRAVAGDLASSYDFVDYFPSYEMVINSHHELTWIDDEIHVQGTIVNRVIGLAVERYVGKAD